MAKQKKYVSEKCYNVLCEENNPEKPEGCDITISRADKCIGFCSKVNHDKRVPIFVLDLANMEE